MAQLFQALTQVSDSSGNPRSGAKLYFYLPGTTSTFSVYQDNAATTPHANPVVADASGLFAAIFITRASYKYLLTTAADVTVQTVDNVQQATSSDRGRVRAATTANVTIATALNNGDTLDGVALVTGDLVLVKNQSSGAENGIYVVGTSPARSVDFDSYNEHPGTVIAVSEGSTNADTVWICTSNAGGTLDSTAITFASFGAPEAAASTAVAGIVELAISAEYRTKTDTTRALSVAETWGAAAEVTLTDASTIAVDMATFINAKVTLTDNRILGQPSNTTVGQCGVIRIIQDGTGSRLMTFHADYKFAAGTDPTLTTTAAATDLLFYQVIAANFIYATLVKAVA